MDAKKGKVVSMHIFSNGEVVIIPLVIQITACVCALPGHQGQSYSKDRTKADRHEQRNKYGGNSSYAQPVLGLDQIHTAHRERDVKKHNKVGHA